MLRKVGLKKVVPGVVEKPLEQQIREMLDADPIKGSWGGLNVVAGWRYNLLSWTEDFTNAWWSKSRATVQPNAVVAPDGTLTGNKLVESTDVAYDHYILKTSMGTFLRGGPEYVYSIHAKKGERRYLQLAVVDGTARRPIFDLETGQVVSTGGMSAYTVDCGDGWYRCFVEGITSNLSQVTAIIQASETYQTYTGDGTSGLYIWGASLTSSIDKGRPYQSITDGIVDYYVYADNFPLLYQDSNGNTPVTAMEQNVGLILDKVGGLGPERWDDATATPSGETSIVSSGVYRIFSSAGVYSGVFISNSLVIGKTYRATFTIDSITVPGGGVTVEGGSSVSVPTSVGRKSCVFTATGVTFGIKRASSAVDVQVSKVSVREVSGNHASQSTPTKRMKISRRVNQLTATELVTSYQGNDNTATFSVVSGDVPPGVIATSVSKCSKAATRVGNWYRYGIGATVVVTPNAINTRSFFFKPLLNCASVSVSTSAGDKFYFNYNFETGAMVVGPNCASATAEQVGNGWWRFTATQKTVDANTSHIFSIVAIPKVAADPGEFLSTGYDSRLAIDAHLPYQWVNTATDYDDDPRKFPTFLLPDVTDDAYVTPVMNFAGTDKLSVWAGITKLSDAATGMVLELSNDAVTNNGSMSLRAPNGVSNNIQFLSKGSAAFSAAVAGSLSSPVSVVVTGIGDISGDLSAILINGVEASRSTADQGTGDYGNYQLHIGARQGTSLFFNGRIYGWLVRPAASTQQQKDLVNRYYKQEMKLPS